MVKTLEQYQHILIVGLGQTGLTVAHYLASCGVGFSVTDTRENPPGSDELLQAYPTTKTYFGAFTDEVFAQADCLVVSPGISPKLPIIQAAKQRGADIVGDIELFVRAAKAPIVAITGSNGKSSLTTILGMMGNAAGIKTYAGGNLGVWALDMLKENDAQLYVMELSSFQLETTQSLKAKSAIVMNVCEDHMDRYDDFNDYAMTKQTVYQGCECAVVNRDDATVMAMPVDGAVNSFGFDVPPNDQAYGLLHDATGNTWLAKGQEKLMAVSELKTPGLHNAANALAALAMGEQLGFPLDAMLHALREFTGLAHRTQWIGEFDGVQWYNDSKGTNVGATVAALQGMPNQTVLIAGGQGKGADFSPLIPVLKEKTRAVILFGEDRDKLEQVVKNNSPYVLVDSLEEAAQQAAALAQAGDNVLLSPACASFDMFKSYGERGEVFTRIVQEAFAT